MENVIKEGDELAQVNTNEMNEITALADASRIVGQADGDVDTNIGWFTLARLKTFLSILKLSDIIFTRYCTAGSNNRLSCEVLTAAQFDTSTYHNAAFVSKGTLNNLMTDRWAHDFVFHEITPSSGVATITMDRRRGFAFVEVNSDVDIVMTITNTGDNRVLVSNIGSSSINVTFSDINGSAPTHSERIAQIAAGTSALYEVIAINKYSTVIQHGLM